MLPHEGRHRASTRRMDQSTKWCVQYSQLQDLLDRKNEHDMRLSQLEQSDAIIQNQQKKIEQMEQGRRGGQMEEIKEFQVR